MFFFFIVIWFCAGAGCCSAYMVSQKKNQEIHSYFGAEFRICSSRIVTMHKVMENSIFRSFLIEWKFNILLSRCGNSFCRSWKVEWIRNNNNICQTFLSVGCRYYFRSSLWNFFSSQPWFLLRNFSFFITKKISHSEVMRYQNVFVIILIRFCGIVLLFIVYSSGRHSFALEVIICPQRNR